MSKLFIISALLFFFDGMDTVEVDDFSSKLENNWKGRSCGFEKIYNVKESNGNKYLSAKSIGSDNFIIKEIKVDIVKYPYLNWKWRVNTLPVAGDESRKEKCDVGASIAVVLNNSKICPKSIKYSWSTTLKKGSFSKSPYAMWPSRSDIYIVESGDQNLKTWKTEKINVLEHYMKLYKEKNLKSKEIKALVIMTDSDNTGTLSEADYDDIFFSSE